MIKLLIILLFTCYPVFAMDYEFSRSSTSLGSYFSSDKASFKYESFSALYKHIESPANNYYYLNANNDFNCWENRFFYFGTFIKNDYVDQNSLDLGVGFYIENHPWWSVSVAGLGRTQENKSIYLTSFRNKFKFKLWDIKIENITFFYPELWSGTNELSLAYDINRHTGIGYRIEQIGSVSNSSMFMKVRL